MTEPDFWKQFLIWRYLRKVLQISPKSDTLTFFSKTALTIFLVFGLKLVLNMTFNLNEIYFSEKLAVWTYLISKPSKIAQIEVFGHFLDFASLVFLDFAHNDRWAWYLVVFLQFAGPVNVLFKKLVRVCEAKKSLLWIYFELLKLFLKSSFSCYNKQWTIHYNIIISQLFITKKWKVERIILLLTMVRGSFY